MPGTCKCSVKGREGREEREEGRGDGYQPHQLKALALIIMVNRCPPSPSFPATQEPFYRRCHPNLQHIKCATIIISVLKMKKKLIFL